MTKPKAKPEKATGKPAPKRKAAPKRQVRPVDPVSGERGLTPAEEAFCTLVATGSSKATALKETHPQARTWKASSVSTEAWKLGQRPEIVLRISELVTAAAQENQLSVNRTLAELGAIAHGDARELVSHERRCCRCCHGPSFRSQMTEAEFLAAHDRREVQRHELAMKDKPDPGELQRPGTWFDELAAPNASCPACAGRGVLRVIVKDLGNLSPEGRAMYAGVEQTKDGVKVKLNDRMAALAMTTRILGVYELDNEQQAHDAQHAADQLAAINAHFDEVMADWRASVKAEEVAMKERSRLLNQGLEDGPR